MAPTLLIAGATGNTGRGIIQTVAPLLEKSKGKYRVIGLTRNKNGATAKEMDALPGVEMVEKDWRFINADWLREHDVTRVFMASAVSGTQYADESLFLNYALQAGVEYVVRISTTHGNVGPTTPVWYGRNHWAIETMLEQPEFKALKWTSLQPNVFTQMFTPVAEAWLKNYRKTGKKEPFTSMLDGDAPVAVVDAVEVGIIAAHLLTTEDVTPHSGKKYIVVGANNTSGKEIVKIIEKHAGTTIDDVKFRYTGFQNDDTFPFPNNFFHSIMLAPASSYDGSQSVESTPTSPELAKLYAPKNGLNELLEASLAQI